VVFKILYLNSFNIIIKKLPFNYNILIKNCILIGNEVVKIMKCIKWLNQILNECHKTFVSCYHAFYPTPHLKLYSLWELLMDKKSVRYLKKENYHFKLHFLLLIFLD